jgi:DNA-binding MurR/RpiR family transcriptional regulator
MLLPKKTKLSDFDLAVIRMADMPHKWLAKEFGVSTATISRIINKRGPYADPPSV